MRKFNFTLKHAFSKSERQKAGIISVRPRWFVNILSGFMTVATVALIITPPVMNAYATYKADLAAQEAVRLAKLEAEQMKEFDAMRIALYCEAKARSSVTEEDMAAIAANILTRVASKEYPDTIRDVVFEKRIKMVAGKPLKVAMYSFIDTPCVKAKPSHSDMHWKMAGRQTHIAMVAYEEGRLKTDSMNYHAPYVKPSWAAKGLRTCELELLGKRGYHLHYAKLSASERKECLLERVQKFVLPKKVPVPMKRPAKDEIAALIKNS